MTAPTVPDGHGGAPLLTLQGLTKSFGGLTAVNEVSFTVEEGTVMGLIGPNGAGKTTVFNLITGNYRPDRGQITFAGMALTGLRTHRIIALGIARTFQNIRLFQQLPALENVLAGCHYRMRSGIVAAMLRWPSQRREEAKAVAAALRELDFVGLGERGLTLGEESGLRRPASAGNRPGAGDPTPPADPGRAGRRHERAGNRGFDRTDRANPGAWRHYPVDRA